ncbi:MAG TPA: transporter [Algoriphagus sp.]|jgi:outer membrane protein TolC|uniref:TolC family protein n=2 Tax=Cyclobacteriaceae TaxID=563798 RepID=UPI000C639A49|nr:MULTISPECIES: TolC family protein [Algoriphagus]MAL13517.1 transporter [Algoriphagus sp.]MAN88687.1 transporter [Algoriphagus sp.]QYH40258.1 TolC family protein [Algoriphagus sp. NBT04N3]HAD51256.1 transporter [Algoriphagus sp.]HAH36950.1 transporter [Algoriphagus sp.]|tara:strand:+ start:13662 stop:14999 length:1338 start_codon:yes stop_codon:yes gene_type:complete
MKKIYFLLLVSLFVKSSFAQNSESLDLEKAIQLGLENNLDVKIAVENINLRQGEERIGLGSFLPIVDAIYTRNYSTEDVTQKFVNDPEPRQIDDAKSRSENFTMAAIYGFRPEAFVVLKRLGLLTEVSQLEAKIAVENTVAGISTAYYRLVLELQRYEVLKKTLELSQARLDIAQAQYELGGAGKRDYLTAEVDYNSDLSLLKTQAQIIQAARINLNELMALDPSREFSVSDTIRIGEMLRIGDLEESAFMENKQWLVTQRQENVAFLQMKELQVSRLPALNLNMNYVNNTSNSDAGFLIQNQREGINYGGNISFNLFSGFTLNRRIQNARVQQKIQGYAVDQFEIQLKSDLYRAYNTYLNNRELLEIEQRNYAVAKESSEIALERFRLGIASYLEFRDAQVNLLTAETRLITSIYNIKEQEIELMRLSGRIFFDSSFEELRLPQ